MKKKVCLILLMAAMCVTVFAGPQKQTGPKVHLIGETHMDLTEPFHNSIREAVQKAVEARGDQFVYIDGAYNQTKQNNGIEDMITRGIEVLLINPVDAQSVEPALLACKAAGVKVIVIDSGVSRPELTETYIYDNHYQGGFLTGKEIVRLYPNGAKICMLENPLSKAVIDRVKGLEDAIRGSKSIIIERKAVTSMEQILSTSEDMLQAHPDVDVFWGLNDSVGLIMLGVLESAGVQNQVRVLAVGGSPSGKKSISEGGFWATSAQSPNQIAAKAVECIYKLLDGEKIDPEYPIDMKFITRDNINQFNLSVWE